MNFPCCFNYTSCSIIYINLDYNNSWLNFTIHGVQTEKKVKPILLQSLFSSSLFQPQTLFIDFCHPSIEFIFNGNKLSLINDRRITTLHCFMTFWVQQCFFFFILQLITKEGSFFYDFMLEFLLTILSYFFNS